MVDWKSSPSAVTAFALAGLLWAPGCSSVPHFAANPVDAGTQCSATQPCGSGQTCLQGRCYAQCDTTHPCAMHETCSSGICVLDTHDAGMPPRDMGMDAGPCDRLGCATPTPVCRGDLALCVQCGVDNHDECGTTTGPVCDVGRATCTTPTPTACSPCNVSADCPTGFSCVTRRAPGPIERVCMQGCGASPCSDQGFTCGAGTVCTPFVQSCTAYHAAVTHRECTADEDCPQVGATIDDGLSIGSCFDDGSGTMTCHVPCGFDSDCPTGTTCSSSNFCM